MGDGETRGGALPPIPSSGGPTPSAVPARLPGDQPPEEGKGVRRGRLAGNQGQAPDPHSPRRQARFPNAGLLVQGPSPTNLRSKQPSPSRRSQPSSSPFPSLHCAATRLASDAWRAGPRTRARALAMLTPGSSPGLAWPGRAGAGRAGGAGLSGSGACSPVPQPRSPAFFRRSSATLVLLASRASWREKQGCFGACSLRLFLLRGELTGKRT